MYVRVGPIVIIYSTQPGIPTPKSTEQLLSIISPISLVVNEMGKGKRAVVTKSRGIAGADKRAEKQSWKKESNRKRYGKACDYNSREEQDFTRTLESLGLQVRVISGDGNCMFRSIGDQLFGSAVSHSDIRSQVVNYMIKEKDTFSLFVEDDESFVDYIDRMRYCAY